jgi:proteasome accessory factor B
MTQEEAGAALDGLRKLAAIPGFPLARAARSAFRKLAFDLEPDAVGEVPIVYADDPETLATRDVLHTLSGALRRRKALTFRYRAPSGATEEERSAHGYGLLFQHGRWYLVAHDTGRGAVRMFRVGRMSDVVVNPRAPGTPDYDVPEDFALDDYTGRKAWELGAETEPGVEATVRFRFPRSLWADRNRHGELIREEADGAQLRRFTVRRADPFLRWVLSLAGDAAVESPTELRTEFRAMAERVRELHAGEARA